jgi:hypothetical protein
LYKEGITPTFTDLEVCDWVDDLGGLGSPKFQEIMNSLSESMNSGLDNETKGKKSNVVKKN